MDSGLQEVCLTNLAAVQQSIVTWFNEVQLTGNRSRAQPAFIDTNDGPWVAADDYLKVERKVEATEIVCFALAVSREDGFDRLFQEICLKRCR